MPTMPDTQSTTQHKPSDAKRRPVSSRFVAAVCLRYPEERRAILQLLEKTRGRVFARRVVAHLEAMRARPGDPRQGREGGQV